MNFDNQFKYKRKTIYSAGILPYQIDDNGNIYILLGKDPEGCWSDFGGRSELKDNNNIIETASREFFEETLNSVLYIDNVKQMMKNPDNFELINGKTLMGYPYYMFILRLPMRGEIQRDRFKRVYDFLKYEKNSNKYLEKIDIQWVSLETILCCLNDPKIENELGWRLRKVFRTTLLNSKHTIMRLKFKN